MKAFGSEEKRGFQQTNLKGFDEASERSFEQTNLKAFEVKQERNFQQTNLKSVEEHRNFGQANLKGFEEQKRSSEKIDYLKAFESEQKRNFQTSLKSLEDRSFGQTDLKAFEAKQTDLKAFEVEQKGNFQQTNLKSVQEDRNFGQVNFKAFEAKQKGSFEQIDSKAFEESFEETLKPFPQFEDERSSQQQRIDFQSEEKFQRNLRIFEVEQPMIRFERREQVHWESEVCYPKKYEGSQLDLSRSLTARDARDFLENLEPDQFGVFESGGDVGDLEIERAFADEWRQIEEQAAPSWLTELLDEIPTPFHTEKRLPFFASDPRFNHRQQ